MYDGQDGGKSPPTPSSSCGCLAPWGGAPPPASAEKPERSRQQSPNVTKDSGGAGAASLWVKNRGGLRWGRKPLDSGQAIRVPAGPQQRGWGTALPAACPPHPRAPQTQSLRSRCFQGPRIAPPSNCPGKGKRGQLFWKRGCKQISKNMMGKRKDEGEVERSGGDGPGGTWAHAAGLGMGREGQPRHGVGGVRGPRAAFVRFGRQSPGRRKQSCWWWSFLSC